MELSIIEKIKILCDRSGVSLSELARKLGKSPQNFHQILKRGNLRFSEVEEIADILGYTLEYDFVKKKEKGNKKG